MIIDCHGHYTTAPRQHEGWRAQQIEAAVRADAIQPGSKTSAAIEIADFFKSAKEGFLHQVLGVLFVASHTKGETKDGVAVPLD